jgi:hypothetical protein
MVAVLKRWTKEEVRSVIRFLWQKVSPVEIHRKLVTVYGANVMTVQHLRKWCREFNSGRVNMMDEKRVVGCPRLLILFRILMQRCKQTVVWVSLNWK